MSTHSDHQKMDPELKRKWVEALRSGEYQQCKGRLHDGVGFCCIGVYGAMAGIPRDKLLLYGGYIGPDGRLALALAPLLAIEPSYAKSDLVKMNDAGASFREIADYIEANL